MRHLVTGGAGFIGSHLIDSLIARGDSAIALDDLTGGSISNLEHASRSGRVEFIEGSTSDPELVESCVGRVDRVIHIAAAVGMKRIMDDPLDSLLSNVRGADIVLAAAARHDRRLIFTSTSEIYGKLETALHEEAGGFYGSPFKTRWSYAIAKDFGEAAAHAYVREGAAMSVVRLFNVVGERQTAAYGMVLPRFVEQALTGEPLTVYGDGTHARCFTSVHDVVRGYIDLLDESASVGNVYNLGSSTPMTIIDLARRVIYRTGSVSAITYVPYAAVYGDEYEDLESRVADTTAVRALTGWATTRTLDQMIDEVVVDKLPEIELRRRPASDEAPAASRIAA